MVPHALAKRACSGMALQGEPDSCRRTSQNCSTTKEERAKDIFANTARLICVGYEVTAAVLVLEAWIKMAKPGEVMDMTESPSEAFDRRCVVPARPLRQPDMDFLFVAPLFQL